MKKQIFNLFFIAFLGLAAYACSDNSSSAEDELSSSIADGGTSSTTEDKQSSSSKKPEGQSSSSWGELVFEGFITDIMADGPDMLAYGQLNATLHANQLLKRFDYGDIVTVVVAHKDTFDAPVVSAWNDVSSGEYLVMAVPDTPYITMGKNYGQTGVDLNIAEPSDGKAETLFILRKGVKLEMQIEITLKQKAGYVENLKMREKQNQGKKRENYPSLNDAEYANFRAIATPGMGTNVLYRSSSPIDPSLGRSLYADSLARDAGISVFINLTDNEKGLSTYENYSSSYYSKQKIAALGLPAAFTSSLFKDGLAKGLRFMIENEGPYLVHCREGKDRAGYVIAVLEALMGASIEDIKNDYTKTYTNYYNVVDGVQDPLSEEDIAWFAKIIVLNMKLSYAEEGIKNKDLEGSQLQAGSSGHTSPLFGMGSPTPDEKNQERAWFSEMSAAEKKFEEISSSRKEENDLQKATEMYLQSIGLSPEEIEALKNRLRSL